MKQLRLERIVGKDFARKLKAYILEAHKLSDRKSEDKQLIASSSKQEFVLPKLKLAGIERRQQI